MDPPLVLSSFRPGLVVDAFLAVVGRRATVRLGDSNWPRERLDTRLVDTAEHSIAVRTDVRPAHTTTQVTTR